MKDEEINMCVGALWENAIDGRLADKNLGSDFDEAERRLRQSFVEFIEDYAP
ncbi:MAG: hypothetical protein KGL39_26295 [Patescibacteria group bacterium]|nr:hypothetical protein [Patescibacteria group bacterium]